jgi:hypothetical protein
MFNDQAHVRFVRNCHVNAAEYRYYLLDRFHIVLSDRLAADKINGQASQR